MNRSRQFVGLASATAILAVAAVGVGMSAATPMQDAPPQRGNQQGMPDLVQGLKDTPGCLGVEAGRMASGKQSIFAWFEDKEAVNRWYYSEMHQGVMRSAAPGLEMPPDHKPMAKVDDDEGPILVIATLTMTDRPHFRSMPNLPISQISIELYKPLPGGAFLGGRLAPDKVKVENMRDFTPRD